MIRKHEQFTHIALTAIALCLPTASWGQAAQQPSATAEVSDSVADIIVTARRREESIQSTPVAVTAFSGKQLAARGISDFQQLANITPGFAFASAIGSTLGGTATIRAQSQPESSELSLDPAVGFYIDDVYIARQNGIFPGLFDIQSVQTLKGPQGTLFGRNTTGGAVVATTRQPELGVLGGFGKALYGNYDAWQLQGGVNIPIGDRIAIRAGGSINRRDGFAISTVTGHEYEDERNEAYRVQALFELSESAKLTLAYNGAHANQGGVNYFLTEVDTRPGFGVGNDTSIAQAAAAGGSINGYTSLANAFARQTDPRRTAATYPAQERLRINSFAGTLDWDVAGANVKLIAAHRTLKSIQGYDDDGSPFALLGLAAVNMDQKQDSLELRVSGTAIDDRLNWIAGGYYLREKGTDLVIFDQLGQALSTLNSRITNETYSGFVQLDYKLTDKLSATAGVRVGRDNREVENRHTTFIPAFGLTLCQFEPAMNLDRASGGCRSFAQAGFTQYAYQLGLNYQASSDLLLYATHKRGFRSGVLNERAVEVSAQQPFEPEIIYDFELGSKLSWEASSELRGHLNSALYYSIFKNRQISFTDITPTFAATTIIESADKAHTWGFEVEADARYSNWLTLSASVAHTDPKYDKFLRRATATRPAVDVSGQPVSNTPKWQYNISGQISQPLGDAGKGFIQADYTHFSSQFFGFSPRPSASDPGHGLLNLSAGIDDVGGSKVRVKGFVKNALNKDYLVNAINLGFFGEPSQAFFGFAVGALGAPRTYGLEVSFDF